MNADCPTRERYLSRPPEPVARIRFRMHERRCSACRAALAEDARIGSLVAAHASATPAGVLPAWLSKMPEPLPVQHRAAWRAIRIGSAAAIIGATVLALGVVLTPRDSDAKALSRIGAAVRGARSLHSVWWRVLPSGRRVKYGEYWRRDGEWRSEDAARGETLILANGRLWTLNMRTGVWRVRRPPSHWSQSNWSGFTMGDRARSFALDRSPYVMTVVGTVRERGRTVRLVAEQRPNERQRTLFHVDSATDLPFRYELQRQRPGGWFTIQGSDDEYDVPFPSNVFKPDFGPRARPYADVLREWRQSISRDLGTFTLAGWRATVRDFQINADGDVFLLYTRAEPARAGTASAPVVRLEMIDKQPWRRNDYRPAVPGDGMTTDGVRIGGEWVRGVWWFALRPPAPRPSHYTLSMTAGGKRATLVLRAPRPTCTLRPRYGDVVMCEDFDPEAIRHIRPFRRGEQAQVFDHNLPRALAYYKQAQAADDAAPYPVSRGTLMRIYEVAHELGLTDEARAALARARDEYPWRTGYSWQQIASALKREGMSE